MASVSSQQMKSVVVGLGRSNNTKIVGFLSCVLDHLHVKGNSASVICELANNVFSISPASDSHHGHHNLTHNTETLSPEGVISDGRTVGPVVLEHAPHCPVRHLSDQERSSLATSQVSEKSVAVAVAVLLESSDGKVLMTQRAQHMRSFPRAWVPPGGHLEKDESLFTCGLRELQEETGLYFKPEHVNMSVLCLWESVYPMMLPFGLPRSHHIVVYLYAKAPYTSDELASKIKLDPEEVMAYAWYTPETITKLRRGEQDFLNVFILEDATSGKLKTETQEISSMFRGGLLWASGETFSGTQAALTRWSHLKTNPISSKI
ncbi:Nucleoside diphosphate-linked moiety X motif 17 [Frankliniella fusca]|uniref:m7GpppN-mRNA hydrolase NUDT17 n=1 Tax=Frankliniella fusca TaxID=407009 RepID=A0AAE1GU25_9NEOP|nr:Nucleoside diphosphate-linked moiety X motif 17 [Frankliniella fusca]